MAIFNSVYYVFGDLIHGLPTSYPSLRDKVRDVNYRFSITGRMTLVIQN